MRNKTGRGRKGQIKRKQSTDKTETKYDLQGKLGQTQKQKMDRQENTVVKEGQ